MEENVRIDNGLEHEADECNRLAPWNGDPYDVWVDGILLGLHGTMEEELAKKSEEL